MKIAIHNKSINHEKYQVILDNFREGILAVEPDHQIMMNNAMEYAHGADLDVIFGSWKIHRQAPWHVTKKDVVRHSKRFIVIETPVIGRGPVKEHMDDVWYRIGVNGFLNKYGQFHNGNNPGDRWEKIKKAFNIEKHPWRFNEEGPIVVVLQLPGDASLMGTDISKWAEQVCKDIRKVTNRQIVVRTPQVERPYQLDWMRFLPSISLQIGSKENLIPTIQAAHTVVTYSSGMGVESLLEGTPTIAYGDASMVYDWVEHNVDKIEPPYRFNRTQLFNDLSYCQWSLDEIKSGEYWKHYLTIGETE